MTEWEATLGTELEELVADGLCSRREAGGGPKGLMAP